MDILCLCNSRLEGNWMNKWYKWNYLVYLVDGSGYLNYHVWLDLKDVNPYYYLSLEYGNEWVVVNVYGLYDSSLCGADS